MIPAIPIGHGAFCRFVLWREVGVQVSASAVVLRIPLPNIDPGKPGFVPERIEESLIDILLCLQPICGRSFACLNAPRPGLSCCINAAVITQLRDQNRLPIPFLNPLNGFHVRDPPRYKLVYCRRGILRQWKVGLDANVVEYIPELNLLEFFVPVGSIDELSIIDGSHSGNNLTPIRLSLHGCLMEFHAHAKSFDFELLCQ